MQTENQREYKEYVEKVRETVERKTGKQVSVQKINKNNGLVLDGLTIMEEGINIAPTIYLNGYYEEYLLSGVDAVANRIIASYEANKPKESVDVSFFMDIEKVSPRIKMKLINYEKNKELLEQVPHVSFLDLAVVFVVVLERDYDKCYASILIKNNHMGLWNISTMELFDIVMKNTADDYQMLSLSAVIQAYGGCVLFDDVEMSINNDMHVLTEKSGRYGATALLHKEILDDFMRENNLERVLIIPSSIYETIIISNSTMFEDIEILKKMVREVNDTQVKPEEVLSYNVYTYDGNEITIAE